MKQQTTALLFCALLLSTFAHDHWRARQHAPPALLHEKSHSKLLSRIQNRQQDEICIEYCTVNIPSEADLNVTININKSIIAIVNTTSNLGKITDYGHGIVALVSGSGEILIINIQTREGIYIKEGASTSIGWIAKNQSFGEYVNSVSLEAIFEEGLKVGQRFTISTITTVELEFIFRVLISLDSGISGSSSQALIILIQITQSVIQSCRQGGRLIISNSFVLGIGGLIQIVNRLQGLLYLISVLNIDIQALIEAGVEFDLDLIGNQHGGIAVFVYIIAVIQAKINIDRQLIEILQISVFFEVVSRLTGQVSGFSILADIIILLQPENSGNSTLTLNLCSDLINYVGITIINRANVSVIIDEDKQALQNLVIISPVAANSSLVQGLLNNSLTYNGVDISAVIRLLLQVGETAAIDIIIGIIVLIAVDISLKILIPLLILQLLYYFGSSIGVEIIKVIFPDIQITLQGIFKFIISLPGFLYGGIYDFLRRLPFIGDVLISIEKALSANGQGSFDLKGSLDHSSSLSGVLWKILKSIQSAALGNQSASANLTSSIEFGSFLNGSYILSANGSGRSYSSDRHLEHTLRDFVRPIHKQFQLEKHNAHKLEKQHHDHIGVKHLHEKHQTHEELHKAR